MTYDPGTRGVKSRTTYDPEEVHYGSKGFPGPGETDSGAAIKSRMAND